MSVSAIRAQLEKKNQEAGAAAIHKAPATKPNFVVNKSGSAARNEDSDNHKPPEKAQQQPPPQKQNTVVAAPHKKEDDDALPPPPKGMFSDAGGSGPPSSGAGGLHFGGGSGGGGGIVGGGSGGGGSEIENVRAECEQHKKAALELAKAARAGKQEVDALRQHLAAMEHEHGMEKNHHLAQINELQSQLSHVQTNPAPQDGPKLHALQQELAILEQANQKLQNDIRKRDDELNRMQHGGGMVMGRGMHDGNTAAILEDLRIKEEELRKANIMLNVRTQEVQRLTQEVNIVNAKNKENSMAAASAQQQLRDALTRIQVLEQGGAGVVLQHMGGGPQGMGQRLAVLERERNENDHAMRELIAETNEKAKTISDLLALQDDMVAELDGMRRDLTKTSQLKDAIENEKRILEETVGRYQMMGSQKEVLEAEKRQLEDAMQRFQQMSRNNPGYQQSFSDMERRQLDEALARSNMLSQQLDAVHSEKMNLEEALARYDNIHQEFETLQAENRQLEEAFQRYRYETEHGGGGGGGGSSEELHREIARLTDENSRWREHTAKQEDELQRLRKLIKEQSEALFSNQRLGSEMQEYYKLKDRVMALDRNISPAVRDLQKVLIQQKSGDISFNQYSDVRLRSTMPELYRDVIRADQQYMPDMYSSTPSVHSAPGPSTISLHSSLPSMNAAALGRHRVDNSLMVAYMANQQLPLYPTSSSAPPMHPIPSDLRSSYGSPPAHAHSSNMDDRSRLRARSVSPQNDPTFAGVKLGIADDILNYKPPSTSDARKNLLSSVPAASLANAGYRTAGNEQRRVISEMKVITTNVAPIEQGAQLFAPAAVPPPPVLTTKTPAITSAASNTSTTTTAASASFPATATAGKAVVTGLSPSEYVRQRKSLQGTTTLPGTASSPAAWQSSQVTPVQQIARDRGLVDVQHVENDDISQDRLDRFARFQQELLNTPPGSSWEEGLSEMALTPDGNIMPVVVGPPRHVLPGISEEDSDVDDTYGGERISRLEI